MAVTIAAEPRLLHAVPGRVRVHVPALAGYGARSVEAQVRRALGVRDVETNPRTGNVLVRFDPRVTTARAILDALRTPGPGRPPVADARAVREEAQTSPTAHTRAPRVLSSGRGPMKRARIAVRGLDRDPDLARRVVERLERDPDVRAHANPLTGRVLVQVDAHRTDIDDLLAAITAVELPALPAADTPSHPLDPAPLIQSVARTVGAILGLGLVTVRRVARMPVVSPGRAYLLQRELDEERAAAMEQALRELPQAAYEHLARGAVAGRVTQAALSTPNAQGEIEVLRAAFLVRRANADTFQAELRSCVEGRDGVHCEYSGPWAPYSFAVPTEEKP
ncbi:MAG TPA: GvpL/GvpF family gas vesicle protein [Chloroflexota bacterium]|nr:GvpL/GvpF family gas vesicle protein [Chloroflexota bacterium]